MPNAERARNGFAHLPYITADTGREPPLRLQLLYNVSIEAKDSSADSKGRAVTADLTCPATLKKQRRQSTPALEQCGCKPRATEQRVPLLVQDLRRRKAAQLSGSLGDDAAGLVLHCTSATATAIQRDGARMAEAADGRRRCTAGATTRSVSRVRARGALVMDGCSARVRWCRCLKVVKLRRGGGLDRGFHDFGFRGVAGGSWCCRFAARDVNRVAASRERVAERAPAACGEGSASRRVDLNAIDATRSMALRWRFPHRSGRRWRGRRRPTLPRRWRARFRECFHR